MVEELRKQQALLAHQQKRLQRMLYLELVLLATVLLTFGFMIVYVVVASQGSRAETCTVIETSRAEKRAQLAQYADNPPQSQLGRDLQKAQEDSLHSWDNLWNSLGCKEAIKHA